MISRAITIAYQEKIKRDWNTLYFAIDLHGTIIKRYTGEKLITYKYAIDVLNELDKASDITLILFSSSYLINLRDFFQYCKQFNVNFKYLNENPECTSTELADFSKKFYFNVLIDDKAGFNPNNDWITVLETVNTCQKMEKCKMIECINSLSNEANYTICKSCNQYGFFSS